MSEEVKINEENQYSFENPEYRKTYWHTCSHVLAQAVKRLWPEVKLAIGPSIDRLLLRSARSLRLYAGASGADRGGDAQDLQGKAQARAL